MPNKRDILNACTREGLLIVANNLDIAGLTGMSKESIIDELSRRKSVRIDDVLEMFPREGLKDLCRKLDLDDSGREKQVIIDRLMGYGGDGDSESGTKGMRMAKRMNNGDEEAQGSLPIGDYRHKGAKRKNNPPAKLAAEGTLPVLPKIEYAYSPRRSPKLQFDHDASPDAIPELLAEARRRPLEAAEVKELADALRIHEPWLEWADKQEQNRRGFQVDPVALHIHERISTQAILNVAAREDVERSLFADPQQEYREAVQFYRHDIDWSNRLILGDSLQVMSSLARREDLSGKVQMIYMDPPYGIKFASNFQPEVGKRDVKDKQEDLTREPEMVRAYRDTWHLGIHSYLSYLRDRLIAARELLADTGSIFVQISDENLHRVRAILDEVFGVSCFINIIVVQKTGGFSRDVVPSIADFLLWYCKDPERMTFRKIFVEKELGDVSGDITPWFVESDDGQMRPLSAEEKREGTATARKFKVFRPGPLKSDGGNDKFYAFDFNGERIPVGENKHWKTNLAGMERVAATGRTFKYGNTIHWKYYTQDYAVSPVTNIWTDTQQGGFSDERRYVVQTSSKVVQRCMLMTTDPGDLVLDPTCGSGTTAYVAEQWGRRWITTDTSRVAVAIARQRMLTSKFDMYGLRPVNADDQKRNPGGTWLRDQSEPKTFKCKTVPHVTLKSIAQNTNLDPIFAKHEPLLAAELASCNTALERVTDDDRGKLCSQLASAAAREGLRSLTDADFRRWLLPGTKPAMVIDAIRRAFASFQRKPPTPKQIASICDNIPKRAEVGPSNVPKNGIGWENWQVPFDTDKSWPKGLADAVTAYRKNWRGKMDDVNACIAANAQQEELVDQPEIVRNITRVSGPFTVEAVQPAELNLSEVAAASVGFAGAPQELEAFSQEERGYAKSMQRRMVEQVGSMEVKNAEAYLEQMLGLLRIDGVRFPNNKHMMFSRLTRIAGGTALGIHADGRWMPQGQIDNDSDGKATVAVSFGPQYGPITAKQVEEVLRSAARGGYDDLVMAGFSFDGAAQTLIEENPNPKVRMHLAHIRPDVNPGMAGLLKEQPGAQLFTVFGQPRTSVKGPDKNGQYTVMMEGVDIYNPVTNTLAGTGADKVAAWFIDGDYDSRTFCITQAFFPDKSAWEKLSKALDGVVDPDRFEALSGTVSLPFPAGKHKRVAVKVIDPRGNEVMQVHRLE